MPWLGRPFPHVGIINGIWFGGEKSAKVFKIFRHDVLGFYWGIVVFVVVVVDGFANSATYE